MKAICSCPASKPFFNGSKPVNVVNDTDKGVFLRTVVEVILKHCVCAKQVVLARHEDNCIGKPEVVVGVKSMERRNGVR